jgi:hypothetical protein
MFKKYLCNGSNTAVAQLSFMSQVNQLFLQYAGYGILFAYKLDFQYVLKSNMLTSVSANKQNVLTDV